MQPASVAYQSVATKAPAPAASLADTISIPSVSSSVRRGVSLLQTSGLYGESDRIASYAPRGVNKLLAPFCMRDLTVCSSLHTMGVHMLWIAFTITIMVGVGQRWAYPDTDMGEKSCPGDDPSLNARACGLEKVLNAARAEFRFLIAFLLSGFVSFTIGMWIRRRTNYASLCGNTRNLLLQITSLLPVGDEGTEEVTQCAPSTRATASRWVLLAFELAVLKSRGAMDSKEGRAFLLSEGLVTEE